MDINILRAESLGVGGFLCCGKLENRIITIDSEIALGRHEAYQRGDAGSETFKQSNWKALIQNGGSTPSSLNID